MYMNFNELLDFICNYFGSKNPKNGIIRVGDMKRQKRQCAFMVANLCNVAHESCVHGTRSVSLNCTFSQRTFWHCGYCLLYIKYEN